MNCFRPKRIKNKYTGEYLYVPCRECDACRINQANKKTIQLAEDMKKYKKHWFITLDYDNYSVPFVIKGMNSVFRYAGYERKQSDVEWVHYDFPVIIDELSLDESEQLQKSKKNKYVRKHFVKDAIPVLYYDDLKNFFKRLRKKLDNGKIKFKYFAVGEYGSRTSRTHFHFVLYGNDERLDGQRLLSAVVESWPFKTWFRPFTGFDEKSFQRCDAKAAGYIASYVQSGVYNNGVSKIKRFRSKTVRSKDVAFSVANQSVSVVKDFINGKLSEQISKIGNRVFEVVDFSRIDRVSARPISERFISSFFPKYKGYGKTTFDSFKARARLIYSGFHSPGRKLEDKDDPILTSLDLAFMRGFERYKKVLINKCGSDSQMFEDYLDAHYHARCLYDSLCLKYEMLTFEQLGDDYFLTKINTYAEDLKKRQSRISRAMHKCVDTLDIDKPPFLMYQLHKKVNDYYYKLLPKHFNDFEFI